MGGQLLDCLAVDEIIPEMPRWRTHDKSIVFNGPLKNSVANAGG